MQWTDDLRIETPEQIDLSLELAGLGSRFVARLLDWGVKWGLLVLVGILVAIVSSLLGMSIGDGRLNVYLLTLVIGLFYFLLLGYDIYFELAQNGQTPGKRRAGIRVMRENGAPPDFRSACIRNLLGMADFLPIFFLLGGLLVCLSSRRQRLGDMAAGTIVVRERAVKAPADLRKELNHLVATTAFAFTPDQLAACSKDSLHILRSFFQRFGELEPQARDQLASRLAYEFKRKTGYVEGPTSRVNSQPEAFLASLFRDLENLRQLGK